MSLQSTLDWFVHDDIKDDIILRTRARILAGVGILFSVLIFLNASRGLSIGDYFLGFSVGIAAIVMFIMPFLLKQTGSVPLASNGFILAFAFVLTVASFRDGGSISQVQYNFAALIVMAILICGLKNGLVWVGYSVFIIILYKIMASGGYQFPSPHEDNFVNLSVVQLMIIVLAVIFEISSSTNLKNFSKQKEKADQDTQQIRDLFTEVDTVMTAAAEGDMTQRISMKAEGDLESLKNVINSTILMLSQTMDQVKTASVQIDSGASQLSNAAQSLASGTTEQAASLEEISSSMDEIGSKARINSDNAQQALSLSNQTADQARNGNDQMGAMLTSMDKIKETSDNVAKVVKVIDEIAFQTNLLALNAAVEAARAGKYGKGFAVVAEEVRNLASRSAEAAKDTTQLIETSIAEVGNGVKNANATAEILQGFVESIAKVNDLSGEISAASQEQANGAKEINESLNQVNNVIQQNSSISEQTASASEELSSQSDLLMNLMNQFKTTPEVKYTKATSRPKIAQKAQPKSIQAPPAPKPKPIAHQAPSAQKPKKLAHQPQPSPTKPKPQLPPKMEEKAKVPKRIILDDDDFGKY